MCYSSTLQASFFTNHLCFSAPSPDAYDANKFLIGMLFFSPLISALPNPSSLGPIAWSLFSGLQAALITFRFITGFGHLCLILSSFSFPVALTLGREFYTVPNRDRKEPSLLADWKGRKNPRMSPLSICMSTSSLQLSETIPGAA